jgi:MFS family permease
MSTSNYPQQAYINKPVQNNTSLVSGNPAVITSARRTLFATLFCISLPALLQGYLLCSSALITYNEAFTSSFSFQQEAEYDSFSLQFIAALLLGQAAGAVVYIPFADILSRRLTMALASSLTSFFVLWSAFSASIWSLIFSRFLLGASLSILLCTAPIYLAEVYLIL